MASSSIEQRRFLTAMPPGTLNLDIAANHITSQASPQSQGKCARAVRLALSAGGLVLNNYPPVAKLYGPVLLANGFQQISLGCWIPRKGDIIVLQPYPGGNPAGHIALYTGVAWVADFKQTDMWAGPGYRQHKPPYAIYRFGGPTCDVQQ